MKRLLLLGVLMVAAATASAQETDPNLKKLLEQYQQKHPVPKVDIQTLGPQVGIGSGLKPPPGVHTLPQDGMPCIVPDTKHLVHMPNALPYFRPPQYGQIPNATPHSKKQAEPKDKADGSSPEEK